MIFDTLLHGEEQWIWVDTGYLGIEKHEEQQAREANWCIALRPVNRARLSEDSPLTEVEYLKLRM
jgi:hypothetical protein